MLRHDLTESRVRFLAAVLSENVQGANFNPIEEADGLRAMLDLHNGNQAAAARAIGSQSSGPISGSGCCASPIKWWSSCPPAS